MRKFDLIGPSKWLWGHAEEAQDYGEIKLLPPPAKSRAMRIGKPSGLWFYVLVCRDGGCWWWRVCWPREEQRVRVGEGLTSQGFKEI